MFDTHLGLVVIRVTKQLRRPDRRDGFLILIGLLALLLGYSYGIATVTPGVRAALHTVTLYVPLRLLGYLWIATGIFAVVAALTGRGQRGFAAVVFMPSVWASAYLISWISGDVGRGWVNAALFYALAGAVFCVAGLIDPTPVITRPAGAE